MKNDSHLNDPAVCDGIPLHLNFMRKKKEETTYGDRDRMPGNSQRPCGIPAHRRLPNVRLIREST